MAAGWKENAKTLLLDAEESIRQTRQLLEESALCEAALHRIAVIHEMLREAEKGLLTGHLYGEFASRVRSGEEDAVSAFLATIDRLART